MEPVTIKIQELIDTLKLRIRAYEQMRSDADKALGEAKATSKEQERKALELAGREKKIVVREQAVKRIEDVHAEEQRLSNLSITLANKEEIFKRDVEAKTRELQDREAALKQRFEKLHQAERDLDAERKAYRTKVVQDLIDKGYINEKAQIPA